MDISAQLRDTVSSAVHEVVTRCYAAAFCVKHTGKLVKEDFRKQNARSDVLRPTMIHVRWYDAVSSSCNIKDKDTEIDAAAYMLC